MNEPKRDPRHEWLEQNEGELPVEVEAEMQDSGLDVGDPENVEFVRSLLMDDPDLLGDFDAFQ